MKNFSGTTLRSGLEIILVSSVYEISAVRLSDTGNEKKYIYFTLHRVFPIVYCTFLMQILMSLQKP